MKLQGQQSHDLRNDIEYVHQQQMLFWLFLIDLSFEPMSLLVKGILISDPIHY